MSVLRTLYGLGCAFSRDNGLPSFGDGLGILKNHEHRSGLDFLRSKDFTHMSFVPLAEWGSIDLDNGILDESVGSDKLVVGGVIDLEDERK